MSLVGIPNTHCRGSAKIWNFHFMFPANAAIQYTTSFNLIKSTSYVKCVRHGVTFVLNLVVNTSLTAKMGKNVAFDWYFNLFFLPCTTSSSQSCKLIKICANVVLSIHLLEDVWPCLRTITSLCQQSDLYEIHNSCVCLTCKHQ